jgi:hypothetical protein
MPTDDDDFEDDRPRRPRNSRDDDDDRPARRRRDDDLDDRPVRRSDRGAGMGIASLVLGILSIPLCLCSWLDIPLALMAIIFGFVSRSQGGPRGTNTAGIICGFAALFLIGVLLALVFSGAINEEQMKQWQMQNKQ